MSNDEIAWSRIARRKAVFALTFFASHQEKRETISGLEFPRESGREYYTAGGDVTVLDSEFAEEVKRVNAIDALVSEQMVNSVGEYLCEHGNGAYSALGVDADEHIRKMLVVALMEQYA